MSKELIIITTTMDDKGRAIELARTIVQSRYSNTVHVTKHYSCYRYNGRNNEAIEYKLDIKTIIDNKDYIISLIKEHHDYELPEIIIASILDGDKGSLEWLEDVKVMKKGY